MGKNSQNRRERRRRSPAGGGPTDRTGPEASQHDPRRAESAWIVAAVLRDAHPADRRRAREELDRLPWSVVLSAAEHLMSNQVATLWASGWQPAELFRQARIGRRCTGTATVLEAAIAVDCARRLARGEQLHPSWRQQAEEVGGREPDVADGWLPRLLATLGLTAAEERTAVTEALPALYHLPPLDVLVPPPGAAAAARPRTRESTADPVLRRVRSLLAKAESTEFVAEAIALTAKAQELITRHAIDTALLDGAAGTAAEPTMVRVPVDPPYADAKSLLLQTVAAASRCRTLFSAQLGHSTVVGFEADLAAVEVLFTSLLVQAQQGLAAAARSAPPGTRPRRPSFRSAFLVAFAIRIGERLDEVNQHVVGAAAAESTELLPVLASRREAVDDLVAARCGEVRHGTVRGGHDPAGWASGRIAADQARLTAGDLSGGD
ncbi:DUF2786 domain-containing protein [Nocardioides sp.]|uniref:DUF2786 domain-containing protein n=1 Tax=Nocardioides sp. TaxID=35761 RepID=UPI003783AAFE